MKVTINGIVKEIDDSLNLEEMIYLFSKKNQVLIVELNGEVIKKEKRKDCLLKEDDVVELIQFVGGG